MITEIGLVAGDIWHQLDELGRLSIKELAARTGRSIEMILMGLGWLAREGHVVIDGDAENGIVSLARRS